MKLCDVRNIVKSNNFIELKKAADYANNLECNFKFNEILPRRNNVPQHDSSRYTYIIKNSTKNQKNLRWRLELENYNYTVEYRTGKTNAVALRAENSKSTTTKTIVQTVTQYKTTEVPLKTTKTHYTTMQRIPMQTPYIPQIPTFDDYFLHFTERPINAYSNQLIFKNATSDTTTHEMVFPQHKRTTICSKNFNKETITEKLKEFHNLKNI